MSLERPRTRDEFATNRAKAEKGASNQDLSLYEMLLFLAVKAERHGEQTLRPSLTNGATMRLSSFNTLFWVKIVLWFYSIGEIHEWYLTATSIDLCSATAYMNVWVCKSGFHKLEVVLGSWYATNKLTLAARARHKLITQTPSKELWAGREKKQRPQRPGY